jgi:hypothetical protein
MGEATTPQGTGAAEAPPDGTAPEGAPGTPPPPETGTTDPPSGAGGNDEAKRYRLQLRDTEAERDGLRTRLESAHRREAEQVASQSLADPSDLWSNAELSDLLTDDGDVDEAKGGHCGRRAGCCQAALREVANAKA